LPDPAGNFQLRTGDRKALKIAGIPNENIERAIAKGAGTMVVARAELEEIRYEGYGPGGIAILIEALTDNRNRTAADLRVAFSKKGNWAKQVALVGCLPKRNSAFNGDNFRGATLEACLEGEADYYEWLEEEEGRR
jgi:transcriptional/translational regulatory protein YebC/TACO1